MCAEEVLLVSNTDPSYNTQLTAWKRASLMLHQAAGVACVATFAHVVVGGAVQFSLLNASPPLILKCFVSNLQDHVCVCVQPTLT